MKKENIPFQERYEEATSLTQHLTLSLHDDLAKQEEFFDVLRDALKQTQVKLDKDLVSRFKDLQKSIAKTRKDLRDISEISKALEYHL